MRGISGRLSTPYLSPNSQFCHPSPLLFPPLLKTAKPSLPPFLRQNLPLSLSIAKSKYPSFIVTASMASSTSPSSPQPSKPFSVLFVCLGNICRSPAAEGVFRGIVSNKGILPNFRIDSAGTIDYHEGNDADPRMRAAAKRRGIEITSISRPIRPSDFIDFDLIVAMDMQNRADILEAYDRWKTKESLPADAYKKVRLMCSYCKKHKETQVPDPYYGGPQGFEKVLDILEDACESLLNSIAADSSQISDT
ncbi:protein-tyrosine phosphatase [Tasmannia lanceolata]|uniref:protein-tyrosine phosphatase n=1 Tax=Tasmannia lanceolata TaxID=3420 RepID=UPI0040642A1D